MSPSTKAGPNKRKAAARRLIIEGDRVVGVEYARYGRQPTELADTEVIVTSGPVGSPKLLLLSGVGPAEELSEVGVPCLHHLPGVVDEHQIKWLRAFDNHSV